MIKVLQGMVDELEAKLAATPEPVSTCSGSTDNDGKKDKIIIALKRMNDGLEAKLAAAPKASGGADDGKKDKMIKALTSHARTHTHADTTLSIVSHRRCKGWSTSSRRSLRRRRRRAAARMMAGRTK